MPDSIYTKELVFEKKLPDKRGVFLIEWKSGSQDLINVYHRPKEIKYGLEFDGGWYIPTWNHKHVSCINLEMVKGIAFLGND